MLSVHDYRISKCILLLLSRSYGKDYREVVRFWCLYLYADTIEISQKLLFSRLLLQNGINYFLVFEMQIILGYFYLLRRIMDLVFHSALKVLRHLTFNHVYGCGLTLSQFKTLQLSIKLGKNFPYSKFFWSVKILTRKTPNTGTFHAVLLTG